MARVHPNITIPTVLTGIAEPIPPELVYRLPDYSPCTFRVVYYEDQKGTHVETAIVQASLTEEEWAEHSFLRVTDIRLESLAEDHTCITQLLTNDIVLSQHMPCYPVSFRVIMTKGKKKTRSLYHPFTVVCTLVSPQDTRFESTVQASSDRVVVLSKFTSGCKVYFKYTFETMDASLLQARLFCETMTHADLVPLLYGCAPGTDMTPELKYVYSMVPRPLYSFHYSERAYPRYRKRLLTDDERAFVFHKSYGRNDMLPSPVGSKRYHESYDTCKRTMECFDASEVAVALLRLREPTTCSLE